MRRLQARKCAIKMYTVGGFDIIRFKWRFYALLIPHSEIKIKCNMIYDVDDYMIRKYSWYDSDEYSNIESWCLFVHQCMMLFNERIEEVCNE